MALTATLYRFKIELSDIDRGVYESLDLRVAMHPSEIPAYLLTRVIAYCLNKADGLEFTPGGLSDTEAPCIRSLTPNGTIQTWIEIGNPTAKKLHKAAKTAREVSVYTYKDIKSLLMQVQSAEVHRLNEIRFYSIPQRFLEDLANWLERNNEWSLLVQDHHLSVNSHHGNLSTIVECHSLGHS